MGNLPHELCVSLPTSLSSPLNSANSFSNLQFQTESRWAGVPGLGLVVFGRKMGKMHFEISV